MQVEILLANLLFGLTILTGAIALAHLVGDLLLGSRNYDPKLRRAIRVSIVSFAITACLASYLYLLGQPGRTELSLFASRARPFLPAGYLIARDQEAENPGTVVRSPHVQEYASVAAEELPRSVEPRLQSYVMPGSDPILYRFVPQFDPAESLPQDCGDWLIQLDALSVAQEQRGGFSKNPAHKIDVFCAAAGDDHRQWRVFSHARTALVVGAVGERPHKELAVFAASWGQQPSGDVAVAFTGWDVLSTPLPFGLRLFFGRDWNSRAGTFAHSDGPESVTAVDERWRPKTATNAALLKRRVGERRLLWTSLPATLHGKLRFSYDAYWQVLRQHVHGWLSGVPEAAPALEPGARSSVMVLLSPPLDAGGASGAEGHDSAFVETADGRIAHDFPKAKVRGLKLTSVPTTAARFEVLHTLHQSAQAIRDTENPPVTVLDLPEYMLLAPALSLGFDAVFLPTNTDRLAPLMMNIKHLKKSDPRSMAPSFNLPASPVVMKGPTLPAGQGGIALEQAPPRTSALSMIPRLHYGEESSVTGDRLQFSEYLKYLKARSDILVQPGRRDGRSVWQIVNLGNHHFKELVLHYHDRERLRIKVAGNPRVRMGEPASGTALGSFIVSDLKPGETTHVEWEHQ